MQLPIGLHATKSGLRLEFTDPLDQAAIDVDALQVKTWSLKRSENYGSEHYDEKPIQIRGATLSANGKLLDLDIPDIRPVWCMEIKYSLRTADGLPISGVLHNTIHHLAD